MVNSLHHGPVILDKCLDAEKFTLMQECFYLINMIFLEFKGEEIGNGLPQENSGSILFDEGDAFFPYPFFSSESAAAVEWKSPRPFRDPGYCLAKESAMYPPILWPINEQVDIFSSSRIYLMDWARSSMEG